MTFDSHASSSLCKCVLWPPKKNCIYFLLLLDKELYGTKKWRFNKYFKKGGKLVEYSITFMLYGWKYVTEWKQVW